MKKSDYVITMLAPNKMPIINEITTMTDNYGDALAIARARAGRTDMQIVVLECAWISEPKPTSDTIKSARQAGL